MLRVFLCHATHDKPAVRRLYAQLKAETWIDPWLDEENLLPGQDLDLEILKALRKADVIIVCLSKASIAKEGYVQKEITRALDIAEQKPEGTIFVIPLRLEECQPPLRLSKWLWVDYFNVTAQEKLLRALRARANELNIAIPVESQSNIKTIIEPTKYTPGGRPVYVFGGMDFVKVLASDFYMGADNLPGYERPQHLVYQLKYDFYIGRFPVTNLQYYLRIRELGKPIIYSKDTDDHPIAGIYWFEAQEHIEWMNKKYSSELPKGFCYRLPSEAEWERAARGKAGNEYPWGNTFDKNKCNSKEGEIGATTPVGMYSPQGDSPEGCSDMVGNVWEWTRSLWGKNWEIPEYLYPYNPNDGRENDKADSSVLRVLRGGAFYLGNGFMRCAWRDRLSPGNWTGALSFRVVAMEAEG